MKYIPKEVDHSVNKSDKHPLKDVAWLVGGSLLGLFAIVSLVVFTSDIIIKNVSMQQEIEYFNKQRNLLPDFKNIYPKEKDVKDIKYIQSLVGELWRPYSPDNNLKLNVKIERMNSENAFMGLGGSMGVTEQLLNNVESENELSFVVCHEIGHFVHRDVLKGVGSKLILYAISVFFNAAVDIDLGIIDFGMNTSMLKFSRDVESGADEFALKCMENKYGHAAGFDGFFKRISEKDKASSLRFLKYMSTHPMSSDRIEKLNIYAEKNNISLKGVLQSLKSLN